jgi:hypothetical protein
MLTDMQLFIANERNFVRIASPRAFPNREIRRSLLAAITHSLLDSAVGCTVASLVKVCCDTAPKAATDHN